VLPDAALAFNGRASIVCESLQGRTKTQAAGPHQRGAEHLGLVVGKGSRKPAGDDLPGEERANKAVRKGRVLVGAEVTLPGPMTDGVGADRPEIRAAPEQHTVSEDEHAAVAPPYAIQHMDVNRIKPILH
jgi:hypothetical protein